MCVYLCVYVFVLISDDLFGLATMCQYLSVCAFHSVFVCVCVCVLKCVLRLVLCMGVHTFFSHMGMHLQLVACSDLCMWCFLFWCECNRAVMFLFNLCDCCYYV